jgi:hypothetical protein
MLGTVDDPGVLRLAIKSLIDRCSADMQRRYLLRMESMEIYNEEVRDLNVPCMFRAFFLNAL